MNKALNQPDHVYRFLKLWQGKFWQINLRFVNASHYMVAIKLCAYVHTVHKLTCVEFYWIAANSTYKLQDLGFHLL